MNTSTDSSWNDVKTVLRKSSYAVKLATIAFLGLMLLIPLGMVSGLLEERSERREQAVYEIENTWGREQIIIGPVLKLPYKKTELKEREESINGITRSVPYTATSEGTIYLLPEQLVIDGQLDPLEKYRGIYKTVVYDAKLKLSGNFPMPDLTGSGIHPDNIQWNKAMVTLQISDLRGASRKLEITLGGETISMIPGSKLGGTGTGVHAVTRNLQPWTGTLPFTLDLQVHGSGNLLLAPLGEETDVNLVSSWPDPSFQGAYSPTSNPEIGPDGFAAQWQVSYFNRNYPQQEILTENQVMTASTFKDSLFGVRLAQLMDSYRPVERAIKYGILFLALVFGAFFLFELMANMRVHIVQYLLIGGALILFYLALLALSEFIGFGWAYLIGSLAATLLITFYSRSILGRGYNWIVILGGLSGVYCFLYITLQLQDYALLTGTLGLFLLLAVMMYVTRDLHQQTDEETPQGPNLPPVPHQPTPPPVPPTAG